ncbi:MAG: hypothetical protein KBC69_02550 [Candidatus Magasanikbacteria bacterium]|nr:hypothetical protein [Candidatus Magasanikbacteria bacterium]
MRTTLTITTTMALLMLILGCSSTNVKRATTAKSAKVTATTKTESKEARKKSSDKSAEVKKKSSSSGTVIGYSTKSDYIVRVSGQKNPEVIQFLRRLENQCSCPDDLITQRIKPTKTTGNDVSAFKLSLSPGMGAHIVFQVMVDDPNNSENRVYLSEQDWPSITAFDGTIDSLREVGVWRSGSYGGKGRGLFKIEELIVE